MPAVSKISLLGLLIVGCASSVATRVETAKSTPSQPPRPPADLNARLAAHYPLRGFVLSESGYARLRFTVAPSGAVSAAEVLEAMRPTYAQACRTMLEQSTWTPARDEHAKAVSFTSEFSCTFEHPESAAPRASSEPRAALQAGSEVTTPAKQPDYGNNWYERLTDQIADRDMGAVLDIEVDTQGRVNVLGVVAGSHPEVAEVCRKMLTQGPPWTPAKDASGRALRQPLRFQCNVQVDSKRMELALASVGAAGPIAVDTVAMTLTEGLQAFSHCFQSAAGLDKAVHGKHWAAFEILPTGQVGRIEWVEQPLIDDMFQVCVFGVLRSFHFAAATPRTIADVQLELGGVQRLGFKL